MSPIYIAEPDVPDGYAIDQGESFWSVCVAEASINLFTDPTLEILGKDITNQKMHAFTAAVAGPYTFTCYVKDLLRVNMSYSSDGNQPYVQSVLRTVSDHTRWTRLEANFYIATPGDYMAVIDVEYVGTGGLTCWWQMENKASATTYFDGSFGMWYPYAAAEYKWDGTPYSSTSSRSANTRSGGRWVSLDNLGFRTLSVTGLGPERYDYNFSNNMTGDHFLESARKAQREFVIGGNIYGCSFKDLADKRAQLVALFRPDYMGKAEPLRLLIEFGSNFPERELFAYFMDGIEGELKTVNHQAYALRLMTAEEGSFLAQGGDVKAEMYDTGDMVLAGRDESGTWTNYDYDDNGQTFPRIVRSIDHDGSGNLYIGGTIAGYVHKVRVAGSTENTMLGTDWNDEFVTDAGPIEIAVSKTSPVYVMAVGFQKRNSLICTGTALWSEISGEWEDLNSGADITCCRWASGKFYVGGTGTVAGELAVAVYDPIAEAWSPIGGGLTATYAQECWSMEVGPDGMVYMTGWFNHPDGFYFLIRHDPVTDKIDYLSRINYYPTFLRTDFYCDITFDEQGRIFIASYIEEHPVDDRSVFVGQGMQFEKRKLYSRTTTTNHRICVEGTDSNFYVSGFVQSYGTDQPYYRYNAIHRVWSSYGVQAMTPFDFLYPVASEPEYVPIHVIRKKLYFAPNLTNTGYKWGVPTTIDYEGTASSRFRLLINGPVTLYSIWNWTTGKQVVLNRPIVVPEYSRAAVFTQNGALFYVYLTDSRLTPQPLNINPAASDSRAMDLVPGTNKITVFFEVGQLIYDPWVQISWRDTFNGL